jgi:hypothetical protein
MLRRRGRTRSADRPRLTALKTRRDSVLPVRFDDTQIPGLASTVHYLSASDYTPEELAELIWRKLGSGEPGVPLERSRVASSDSSQAVDSARARPAPGAPPGGSDAAAEHEAWLARHRLKAVAGLAELGKIDFYEVAASIQPELPMPSQTRLSDAVASKNIDTFGWPIGVFIASQPPRPVVEGIIAEIRWDERSTYDYWVLSRTGNFYLLKTLSEDPLDAPDKLYFNTRIIRVAETVLFLAGLYQELGSGPGAVVRLDVVHSGIRHRTLSAVGRRRGTFIDRHTIEDQVRTSTAFTIADVGTRLVEVVKELVGPLFMLYEYLEIDHSVYADLIDKFREGQVT